MDKREWDEIDKAYHATVEIQEERIRSAQAKQFSNKEIKKEFKNIIKKAKWQVLQQLKK